MPPHIQNSHDPLHGTEPATRPRGGGLKIVHRYPLEPLANTMGLSLHQTCKQLGLSGSTEKEYRARGVTERVADRLAVKAGFSPYDIWPEMIDHIISAAEQPCAWHGCQTPFLPSTPQQKYCTGNCRRAASQHRRYRDDPDYRARRVAARAAYYAENRDYELARQRRYDRARTAEARNRQEVA